MRHEYDKPAEHVEYQRPDDVGPRLKDNPIDNEVHVTDAVHAQVREPEQKGPRRESVESLADRQQLVVQILDGLSCENMEKIC